MYVSLQITTFSSASKVAQKKYKMELTVFEDGIEGPILSGSHLKINAEEKVCPGFQQFLIHSNMGPDLPLMPSHQRLQWSCSDLHHGYPSTPLLAAQPSLSQKETFPLHFFWSTFTSCFLLRLTVCCMSL